LGLDEEPQKPETGLWLPEDRLRAYLRGETVQALPSASLFQREDRIGIGRDDRRRTAAEHALYEVGFIRPESDTGLLVEVEGYQGWPPAGLMRIGGEARAARFQQVDPQPWTEPPDPLPRRFKVFFATPAYFDGGWQPQHGAWDRFFQGSVRLTAAAVGRYESVGGYDWAGNAHKPSRRYVPAGSVYYFESEGATMPRDGALTACATAPGYEAAIGFGQGIIEEW